jgi:enterochelin esterase family protein
LTLPGGSVVEFKSFDSRALGTAEPYSVLLPPSYMKEPSRTYPVLYFLHGLNNDHTSWTVDRYGNLQNAIEAMMLAKKTPEFIMVHPHGDSSFYCNFIDGSRRYEDLIVHDLIELMETQYRAKKGRENRALGGTSMGGFGALKIAMKFPELFASAAGHSPIIFLGKNPLDVPEQVKSSRYYQFFVQILKPILGDPVRQEVWDANNPLLLARDPTVRSVKLYMDYGTEDRYNQIIRLDEGVKALDRELTAAEVPHVFKTHPGEGHGWALVAAHIGESLPFLCQNFKP